MESVRTALVITATQEAGHMFEAALREAGCDAVMCVMSIDDAIAESRRCGDSVELAVVELAALPVRTDLRRLSRRLRGAPIVAIATDDAIEVGFECGATDCLASPVRIPELVARTRAALRLRAEQTKRSRRERRMTEEIRRLAHANGELERVVCVDSLTGLANRRHALTLLGSEWRRSARDKTQLSVVMIDLDFFHAFNEHYGHLGGDQCLRRVTEAMVKCLRRPSDFLGRYGGEEFIAVLPNTDAIGARIVAERLRGAVEGLAIPHERSGCAAVVTISVGFATCQATVERSSEYLISAADCALLRAKSFGRNGIVGEAPAAPVREPVSSQPWTRHATVVADPWFVERIPEFLSEVRDEARGVRDACDFDRIRMVGRRLKAMARDVGLEQVRQLANAIENAARFEDQQQIREAADELEHYATHVQVVYRRPLEQAS
jgi:diguanylate cyclase (GGDEF)-like protein